MPRKAPNCTKPRCHERAEIRGFCRAHYDEHVEDERLGSLAACTLHGNAHAHAISDVGLRTEFYNLRQRWDAACLSVNHQVEDPVLKDEAQWAVEWCIALAKEMILADRALKEGKAIPASLADTRRWVGERFANLEAGLKSNGAKRSSVT